MEGNLKYVLNERHPLNYEKFFNDPRLYGRMIKQCRTNLDMDVIELSKKVGCTHGEISKIENGERKYINIAYLMRFAAVFECSYTYLLGRTDDPNEECYMDVYINPLYNQKLISFFGSHFKQAVNLEYYGEKEKKESCSCNMQYIVSKAKAAKKGIIISSEKERYYLVYLDRKSLFGSRSMYLPLAYDASQLYVNVGKEKNLLSETQKNFEYLQYLNKADMGKSLLEGILIVQSCKGTETHVRPFDPFVEHDFENRTKIRTIFYDENGTNIKNIRLLNYLFSLKTLEQLDEVKIIDHLNNLVKTDQVLRRRFGQLIENLIRLDTRQLCKIDEIIKKATRENRKNSNIYR